MTSLPSVSIIIPCRNESVHIAACVESVLKFDYPSDLLEVLFIDGISTDNTAEIITGYVTKYPFIKLLNNPAKTVPPAMNIGIKNAKGAIIVRLDAHSAYPADYLSRCIDLLNSTGAANAGGRFVNIKNGNGPWAEAVQFVTGHKFGVGNGAFRTSAKPGFVDTVPFGTFRRDIFDKVGYFDERLTRNQDNEFNARITKAGYKIAFDPNIKIFYKNQATLSGLLNQAYSTAAWNIYTLKLCPYTFTWRRFVPAVFVAYLALLPASTTSGFGLLFSIPLALYAGIALYYSVTAPYGIKEKSRILITFFLYHLAYGTGTFYGVFNLATGRWKNFLGKPLIP